MKGPISKLRTEDMRLAKEYWAVRKKYEAVFGKLGRASVLAPRPIADRIKELSDKLDEHYRRQREQQAEKREPELAAV